jgi:hypothetical protein
MYADSSAAQSISLVTLPTELSFSDSSETYNSALDQKGDRKVKLAFICFCILD